MYHYLKNRTISLFLLIICSNYWSCLDEPDYLDTYKTDFSQLSNMMVEQLDAFSLKLSWQAETAKYESADGFLIESYSDSNQISMPDFDSTRIYESDNFRSILLLNSDSGLVNYIENDITYFTFIDDSVSYNQYNYYRITILKEEVKSYSIKSDSGFYFSIPKPENLKIIQQNDYQLKLSWEKSKYTDGYIIERIDNDSDNPVVFSSFDTTFLDSSHHPTFNVLEDTVYTVSGIQANKKYFYEINAYAGKEGYDTRFSKSTMDSSQIRLIAPNINGQIPINDSSVRLYLDNNSVDRNFDTLFVLDKNNSDWECIDTLLYGSLTQVLYKNQYLIDVSANIEADYKIVSKGKINALSSPIVHETPLDITGFTFIEGGDFSYGEPDSGISKTIRPFYFSIYEFGSMSSFPTGKGVFPEDSVSWLNAITICSTLTADPQYNYTFRLPSEEEWEYAAKWDIFKSIEYDYPWASNNITGENANYLNSGDPYDNGLTPTGYYDGNNGTINSFSPFGLYDMGGNVMEWCGNGNLDDDLQDKDSAAKPLRGGSYWNNGTSEKLKTTVNFLYDPDKAVTGFGFRVVMEINN